MDISGWFSATAGFQWESELQGWIRDMELTVPEAGNDFLGRANESSPLVKIVDYILTQAVESGSSDIHFEPQGSHVRIRFRLDGELAEVLVLPAGIKNALVSRIKIMSNMDIAEKRLPQDGRFQFTVSGQKVDFRAATLPTIGGEKVMLRILRQDQALQGLPSLGFAKEDHKQIRRLLQYPHGMILIVGPTGSGKTTTLYSMLGELDCVGKNIVTLEDPVEYALPGINQVAINPKIGLTFAGGLRSLLRQDPDVIMVGEIRDSDTAKLAVNAALTGHLVFSTLHTNSGVGVLTRLYDMGVERFLIANSLIGVISQRLVRKLCRSCAEAYRLSPAAAKELNLQEADVAFYRPVGCERCRNLGYAGRIAVYEVLPLTVSVRRAWMDGEDDESRLEARLAAEGQKNLRADGLEKARRGITSLEEVLKVSWGER